MFTVLLSFSGVFYGYVIANMDFVILMTMMGIISLAGIVVKNGIVLMDFFVLLLDKKVADNNLKSFQNLAIFRYFGPNPDLLLNNNDYSSQNYYQFFPSDKITKVPTYDGYYLEFDSCWRVVGGKLFCPSSDEPARTG